MKETWILNNKQADFAALSKKMGVPPLIIKLMINRGITERKMRKYLSGKLSDLSDPYKMKDLKKTIDILKEVGNKKERIAVVTDYDCDGVFSGMILYEGIKKIGGEPVIYTPDRQKDGYGINRRIIDEAYNEGINYLITCDNGIAAATEVSYAKSLGMTVIITDHHEIPYTEMGGLKEYTIPEADAVVDPKQADCEYSYKELCGAGVCYILITALYKELGIADSETEILTIYAAIATIADIMPLTGENRIIVKYGLMLLSKTNNPGLYAIKEANNLIGRVITPYHIGFVIGPCFNAAGRLENASAAFDLLMTSDPMVAAEKAAHLKELNDMRKNMTEEGAERGILLASDNDNMDNKVLVLYIPDCHESLIGIIAGRIKEMFYKPTIVFTDGEDGLLKGSGRSIEAYDMFAELSKVKSLFVKMGGHKLAAGMTIHREDFGKLSMLLNVNETLTTKDLTPVVRIDAEVLFRHLSMPVVSQFSLLEPCGNENGNPLFVTRNVKIKRARIIGKNQNVLRMTVADAMGDEMEMVSFNNVDEFTAELGKCFGIEEVNKMFDGRDNAISLAITYEVSINEYNGIKSVQLNMRGYML